MRRTTAILSKRTVSCILLLCALLASLFPALASRAATDYTYVKVKLTTNNATSLTMYVNGSYFIAESGVPFSGGTLSVRASSAGLVVSHSALGDIFSGKRCSIKRVSMDRGAGYLTLNSRRYLGHFDLKQTGSGYIQVVNEVPMAHYLYGVVGYEMSDLTFKPEALKAQAIAAKGYVMSQFSNADYYIGDTSADQVYKGYDAAYTNVISAVDSTISEVLTYNGNIMRTYFAASNGGETNLPTYAWPGQGRSDGGYGVTQDPFDLQNDLSPCETVKIPINTGGSISPALFNFITAKASAALGVSVSAIESITSVSTSGEAYAGTSRNQTTGSMSVLVRDAAGNLAQTSFTFRMSELYAAGVVSNASLRIYWGEYVNNGASYYIYHLRYGHGVGLSQRGAQQRAAMGQDYRSILAFYYPGAQLAATSLIGQPQDPVNVPTAVAPTPDPALPTPAASGAPVTGGEPAVVAYGQINYDDTNYRAGPGTSYPSYGKLNTGAQLVIYGEADSWYVVGVNNTVAYVYKQYVDITGRPEATPAPAATPVPVTPSAPAEPTQIGSGVLTTSNVNFRSGPASSYKSLGKLRKGDVVRVYGKESDWYYVAVESTYGYVSSKYVTLSAVPASTAAPASVVTPAPTAAPSSVQGGLLTTSNVNLRSAASKSSTSLRKLSKNTAVQILGEEGDWYYIAAGAQQGYVYKTYVKLTGAQSVAASGSGAGVTTGSVNMRTGPATSYKKVAMLKKDTQLAITGEQCGWYAVTTAEGKMGYVSGKYLRVTSAYTAPAAPSPVETPAPSAEGYPASGETTGKVNFREAASTSSKKLAQLPKGAQLTLYGLSNGWFDAGYNSLRGYVSAQYVKKSAAAVTPVTPVATGVTVATNGAVKPALGATSGEVNFRTLPSTTGSAVLQKLAKGASVQLLGKCGAWYYALYGGTTGYLSEAYIHISEAGSFGMPSIASGTRAYTTTTRDEVNMRTGPATSYDKIGTLPKGAPITVYITAEGWCLVSSGSSFAFISAEYVAAT